MVTTKKTDLDLEYQATADSVAKKLTELYNSLSVREQAVLGGLLGQAASAGESAPKLTGRAKKELALRKTPLGIQVADTRLDLHVLLASW